MIWRWDQGRKEYSKFESIIKIAPVLLKYNGADLKFADNQFRSELIKLTGLPFAVPPTHSVKRNYKRILEITMLCSFVGQRLFVSDIGKAIASQDPKLCNVDGYLSEIQSRFRYPYPSFDNYSEVKVVCFPLLAILKFLFARAIKTNNPEASISLTEIGEYLIANDVTGTENLEFYKKLAPKADFSFESYGSNDQLRQVREMMQFVGQHTYIKVKTSSLSLVGLSLERCLALFYELKPFNTVINSKTLLEDFQQITAYTPIVGEFETQTDLDDFSVQEGKKVFTSHFSYERDSSLRKEFIKRNPLPVCDVCGMNMHIIYPWTDNMLEIHHLHPLSSNENPASSRRTSIDDVVGICPSCHRAIHIYYKKYLIDNNIQDFESKEHAIEVYKEAKAIVRNNINSDNDNKGTN